MMIRQHDIPPEICNTSVQYPTPPPSPLSLSLSLPLDMNTHIKGQGKKRRILMTTNEASLENLEENLFDFLSIYLFHIHVFIHLFVCLLLAQRN